MPREANLPDEDESDGWSAAGIRAARRYQITLGMRRDTWAAFAPELDQLVKRFGGIVTAPPDGSWPVAEPVEIVLAMDRATYEQIGEPLDELTLGREIKTWVRIL